MCLLVLNAILQHFSVVCTVYIQICAYYVHKVLHAAIKKAGCLLLKAMTAQRRGQQEYNFSIQLRSCKCYVM